MKTRDQRQEQLQDFGPLFTGQVLRDEGIKTVTEHNESWMELCLKSIERVTWQSFTGEDVRFHCSKMVGLPHHSNAWGALINSLVKRGIIEKTGEYRPMRDDNSHARSTPVYRRLSRK